MDNADEKPQPEWGIKLSKFFVIPQRWIMVFMSLMGLCIAYSMRVCLSVAITRLVVERNYTEEDTASHAVCPAAEKSSSSTSNHIPGPELEWSQELQGMILSSFYYGYLISQLPGGLIAEKYGPKYVLSFAVITTSICTFLTPLVVESVPAFIALRVGMGLSQGFIFPSLNVILSRWIPPQERSTCGSLVLGGGQIGSVLGNGGMGYLLSVMRWEHAFYLFGSLGFIWFLFFVFLCYSDPTSHPFIKPQEKEFLLAEVPGIERKNHPKTPWVAILKSMPIWALIVGQLGHDWAFYVILSDMPKYFNDVLQFSIKENGAYSSLPYIMMWVMSIVLAIIADWLLAKGWMSLTNIRIFMSNFGSVLPAVFMIAASYAGCNHMLVVVFFTLCLGTMGGFYPGLKLAPLDMCPNFSGTIMGIVNGIGSLAGMAVPVVIGFMTPNTTMGEWRLVFWVTFIILVGFTAFYSVWATAEVQDWNDPNYSKKET